MANLLDALKPKMEDTTSQLSRLIRAKSGKGLEGPSTTISTQQERGALAQTGLAMQPVEAAEEARKIAEDQQTREIEQRKKQELATVGLRREDARVRARLEANKIMADLEEGKADLSTKQLEAAKEQLGINLRLGSEKYVTKLQNEGRINRLDNGAEFELALQRSIFEDGQAILQVKLNNKSILNANEREYEIALEKLDAADAISLLKSGIRSAQDAAVIQSISSVLQVGIQAAGDRAETEDKTNYYTKGAGRFQTSYEAYKYGSPAATGKYR